MTDLTDRAPTPPRPPKTPVASREPGKPAPKTENWPQPPLDHPAFAPLSRRQREIAALRYTGLTSPAISAQLGISPNTVASHLYKIYKNLGASTLAEFRRTVESVNHVPTQPQSSEPDEQFAIPLPPVNHAALKQLGDRQREVARLRYVGLPPAEIAKRLKLATKTAYNHWCAVQTKLDITTVEELRALLDNVPLVRRPPTEFAEVPGDVLTQFTNLTPRQRAVGELIASSHSLTQVAGKLGITQRTVNEDAQQVYRKTGITSAHGLRALYRTTQAAKAKPSLNHLNLGEREGEVACLRYMGLTSEQIGQQLNMATNTARTHLHNVYKKLGVSNLPELRKVIDNGGYRPSRTNRTIEELARYIARMFLADTMGEKLAAWHVAQNWHKPAFEDMRERYRERAHRLVLYLGVEAALKNPGGAP